VLWRFLMTGPKPSFADASKGFLQRDPAEVAEKNRTKRGL